jgi:hypothetical protein
LHNNKTRIAELNAITPVRFRGFQMCAQKLIEIDAMEAWKQKAKELLPELVEAVEEADTPYLLWFELREAFERAYDRSPRNESLIRRIYQYSDWCVEQPGGRTADDDLLTCVAVCFYEHIPQHPEAREDMPRWWRAEDLKEPSIFQYHLSEKEFRDLQNFLKQENHHYNPSLRSGL